MNKSRHSDSWDVFAVTRHSDLYESVTITRHSRSSNALLRLMRRRHRDASFSSCEGFTATRHLESFYGLIGRVTHSHVMRYSDLCDVFTVTGNSRLRDALLRLVRRLHCDA